MAFIELVEKEGAPPEVLEVYEAGEAVYGRVLEAWKAIAHNPAILNGYFPYVRAVFGPGPLDQRTKDLVAVRICYLNHCLYSLSHRVFSARNQGIADEDLEALADPGAHDFTAAEQAALTLAEELTTGPVHIGYAENPQVVSAATLAAVRTHFSDAEINDLAISVGLWNLLTRYHRLMDFELDMPMPPGALDVSSR